MKKNGYLYVYLSNESKMNVYFDDITVEHERSALVEETHYYPWGLTMAGISSKALGFGGAENKYKYNGIEFESDLNLNTYDAQFRELDPQIGRWCRLTRLQKVMKVFLCMLPCTTIQSRSVIL
jgi:hypothetical protein